MLFWSHSCRNASVCPAHHKTASAYEKMVFLSKVQELEDSVAEQYVITCYFSFALSLSNTAFEIYYFFCYFFRKIEIKTFCKMRSDILKNWKKRLKCECIHNRYLFFFCFLDIVMLTPPLLAGKENRLDYKGCYTKMSDNKKSLRSCATRLFEIGGSNPSSLFHLVGFTEINKLSYFLFLCFLIYTYH